MFEALDAVILLLLLVGSAGLGMVVKSRLPERHQSRETIELVGFVITLLVTFAALVMSLLIYSVKGAFDQGNTDMAAIAGHVVQLDQCLRNYGPETANARIDLRRYTEGVIASTWPGEARLRGEAHPATAPPVTPGGMESRKLGSMLNQIGLSVRHLTPANDLQRGMAASCLDDYRNLEAARWVVIEEARSTISVPFYLVLVFWLVVIFACFGLNAPRNAFVFIIMALCAVSIASAVFVILDMDTPFTGYLKISSQPMRNAFADISLPYVPPSPAAQSR
jgi:hypothetical protein